LERIEEIAGKLIGGELLSREEALELCPADGGIDLLSLMGVASGVREHFFGRKVSFCSIINAKSGRCPSDCIFCAQSARHRTEIEVHPMMEKPELLKAIERAASDDAAHVGIVTSGVKAPEGKEFDRLLECVREVARGRNVKICCSLGQLDEERARLLKEAGVTRYHHNLESSRMFYGNVSKMIGYEDKEATVRAAKGAGLETCCGGIFGLGESWGDRVELAMTIRELDVDSVPLNFLRPVKGTPLGDAAPLNPREALRIIALFRLMLPDKTIKVCGGREFVLRDMQSWMFHAGANGAILGNYLTTAGRPPEEDLLMVEDLGLEVC
jgi:biotin synthase